MRTILIALLLLTPPALASECLPVVNEPSPPQIVLRGVVEYRPSSLAPDAVQTWLKLATPICVRGRARDGLPFTRENVESIQLGLPTHLLGTLQPLERVTLRGELQGPAVNGEAFGEALDNVGFSVKEVCWQPEKCSR
jgi:hypothetical protein